jgi:hypothetical protein
MESFGGRLVGRAKFSSLMSSSKEETSIGIKEGTNTKDGL